jgi:hypothetical protein
MGDHLESHIVAEPKFAICRFSTFPARSTDVTWWIGQSSQENLNDQPGIWPNKLISIIDNLLWTQIICCIVFCMENYSLLKTSEKKTPTASLAWKFPSRSSFQTHWSDASWPRTKRFSCSLSVWRISPWSARVGMQMWSTRAAPRDPNCELLYIIRLVSRRKPHSLTACALDGVAQIANHLMRARGETKSRKLRTENHFLNA